MVNEVATQTAAPISYAVIFPGQGSQSVGMLADWAAQYPIVKATFDEASAALGFDLWAVCQGNENAASLDDTAYTQPALLTRVQSIRPFQWARYVRRNWRLRAAPARLSASISS